MAQTHAVLALVAKHAELAGEIQEAERRLAQFRADLMHVEATLRIFDPEYPVAGIRPKRLGPRDLHFTPGELARLTLDTLRTAPEPLTTRKAARRIMAVKGLDLGDRRLLDNINKRLGGHLRRARTGRAGGRRRRRDALAGGGLSGRRGNGRGSVARRCDGHRAPDRLLPRLDRRRA